MPYKIVVLPGDGIGPEVTGQAVAVLQAVGMAHGLEFAFEQHLMGGCSIDAHGVALTDEVLAACQASDAVLLGAVGGPKWDDPTAKVRPEQGLLRLRKELGLFANLRPVTPHPGLLHASPLKEDRLQGVDILVVRELTGGIYFGQPRHTEIVNGKAHAVDTLEYWEDEIERVVRLAFAAAQGRRKRLASVDKANILDTSRLWRRVVARVADDYPDVTVEHVLVDAAAMYLITQPSRFDVIVTENMFGDILTDEASVLTGSMGNLPSASLGSGGPGLYEPIHGSAPDIAGQGVANPLGTILSAALLLRHSLNEAQAAADIENAVRCTLDDGLRTRDLGGGARALGTAEMGAAVIARLGR